MKILILNGPNINLVGIREKSVYGSRSFTDYLPELKEEFKELELEHFQSNHEGALIDKLHEVGFHYKGIVLNAGGFTHTSVALADALAAIETPVVEVHISNVFKRESYRHTSLLSKHCSGVISGFGLESYRLALLHFLHHQPKKMGFSFGKP